MGNRIFVGNLPWASTESDLRSHFASVGVVNECKIMTDRETGRSRGFGFVTMSTDGDAARAINELNDVEFLGRRLIVNEARDRASSSFSGPSRSSSARTNSESRPYMARESFPNPESFPPMDTPDASRTRSRRFNDKRRNRDDFDY